ncbi:phage tail family protein [Lactobacillus reuteri]|nr:phage tail family protein [Limosilactobacillus reuteri]MQB82473.1 phage tail family protein [Limosilactobacillus reuteri]MQB84094.1 phage tail family protein [Limosilactobacillus reuteri]
MDSFMRPSELGVGGRNYLSFNPIEFSISPDGVNWHSCYDDPDLQDVYCYQAPDVQPANQTDSLKKIGLVDGQRLLSSSYDTRTITMRIICRQSSNEASAMLGYDALQRFLVSREPYWICFENWPQRMYYVKAKMGAPTFTSDRSWTCEVTLTDFIGLSRSIATSVDYQNDNGFGNNMPIDQLSYSFTSNSFTVNNLSDTIIDPERRNHPLKITLQGSSNGNMKITNKTTGNSISRVGVNVGGKMTNSAFNGIWVLDGVRVTLNGNSDQMQCDTGVITLQPGNNDFQIDNFSGKVTFDFPFWWLS